VQFGPCQRVDRGYAAIEPRDVRLLVDLVSELKAKGAEFDTTVSSHRDPLRENRQSLPLPRPQTGCSFVAASKENNAVGGSAVNDDIAPGADSIALQPESQISITCEASPNQQEIERRRKIVRQFFNDFWMSTDDKPRTFAERLNRAEDHINGQLAARGETWQLDAATRKQLGLPPPSQSQ
jgi:hypothetical protein